MPRARRYGDTVTVESDEHHLRRYMFLATGPGCATVVAGSRCPKRIKIDGHAPSHCVPDFDCDPCTRSIVKASCLRQDKISSDGSATHPFTGAVQLVMALQPL